MKFKKFGKALLMTAISAGMVFGVSSCVQSYTVGYLYVTGLQTASTNGVGVISGFKIDHNTGNLVPIAGLPVSTGGSNPVRTVLLTGGRFLYVLNQGSHSDGSACTTANPCTNGNITQFSIGGNGVLAFQATYYTQGLNPFRMLADSTGAHIFVLDHDSPDNASCALVFGPSATSCGDITSFSVDSTTGRLSVVLNSQVTAATGAPLPYFPVPANPIDFSLAQNFGLVLFGTPGTGDSVFPYAYNPANGQFTVNQNSSQPLGISQATAINFAGSVLYVLDNGLNTNTPATHGQIFAYSIGSNGSLQAQSNGYAADDPLYSNPTQIIAAANSKPWVYLMNTGDNIDTTSPQSGITVYQVLSPFQLQEKSGQGNTAGSGAGPQCILEDPSNQFIYTANYNDSSVTGRSIDQNQGLLRPLSQITKAKDSFPLPGPGTWCVVTGRTS